MSAEYIEKCLKQADHVDVRFGRYKVLNTISKHWLIVDTKVYAYVQYPTGGNIIFHNFVDACEYAIKLNET